MKSRQRLLDRKDLRHFDKLAKYNNLYKVKVIIVNLRTGHTTIYDFV